MKIDLNLEAVSTLSSKVVVPTGSYSLEVVGCELKETKSKNGHYLAMAYKVIGGDQNGVVLADNLNIANPNEDAQRIGQTTLKTVLTYGGHKNPNFFGDTNEAMGLKFNCYIEEEDTTFEAKDGSTVETTQNKFKSYSEFDTVSATSSEVSAKPSAEASKPPVIETEAPKPEPETAAASGGFPWQK